MCERNKSSTPLLCVSPVCGSREAAAVVGEEMKTMGGGGLFSISEFSSVRRTFDASHSV